MKKTQKATQTVSPRALHLIDIENQVCGRVTPATCRDFLASYRSLGLIGPADHVILGVSPENLANTFTLPIGWRRVVGPEGAQSADLAILDAEPALPALQTYDELILASADAGFLALVLRARAAGLKVTIVSNAQQEPHWRMYVAGSRHLTVDVPHGTRQAVA